VIRELTTLFHIFAALITIRNTLAWIFDVFIILKTA